MKGLRSAFACFLILAIVLSGATVLYAKDGNGAVHRVRIETEKQNKGLEKESRERIQVRSQFSNESTGNAEVQETKKHLKKFVVYGKLLALDAQSITVFVSKATKNGREFIGKEVTFSIDSKTRVKLNKKLNQIGEVGVSSLKVSVQGYADEDRLVATRVLVKMPSKVVINGTVGSVFDGGFTVKVKTSNNKAFATGNEVKVLTSQTTKWTIPSTATASLKTGAYIQVTGYEKEGELLAIRVVIKAKPASEEIATNEETTESSEPVSDERPTETTDENQITESEGDSAQEATGTATEEPGVFDAARAFFQNLIETLKDLFARLF